MSPWPVAGLLLLLRPCLRCVRVDEVVVCGGERSYARTIERAMYRLLSGRWRVGGK